MPNKKSLKKKADNLWSKRIREKGKCEVCGQTTSLNAHHIVGRRNLTLRWDLRNGVCLCSGCHVFRVKSAHQDPLWFHEWLKENRGEDLEYLLEEKNKIEKPDYESIVDGLMVGKRG